MAFEDKLKAQGKGKTPPPKPPNPPAQEYSSADIGRSMARSLFQQVEPKGLTEEQVREMISVALTVKFAEEDRRWNQIPWDAIKIACGQWLQIRKRAETLKNSAEHLTWVALKQWLEGQ